MRWSEADVAAYYARTRQGAPRQELPEARSPDELERDFQSRVMHEAHRLGYRSFHVHRSDRSAPGWFDLALARPGDKLVLAELKRRGEKQTEAQRDWYEDLQRIKRVQTYLWYPKDWETIVNVLTRKG